MTSVTPSMRGELTPRLCWRLVIDLDLGVRQTVEWYLDNEEWWGPLVARGGALNCLGNTVSRGPQSPLWGTDQPKWLAPLAFDECSRTTRLAREWLWLNPRQV